MTSEYDPEQYWNAKVERSPNDPKAAVRIGDSAVDRCIERIQRHLLEVALQKLEEQTPLDQLDVLDFGCGTGQWATMLSASCRSYSGADISERMLDAAEKSFPQYGFHKVSNNQLSFADNSFDLVSSIAVLHHNSYVDQDRLVGELRRVLRPNGWLISFEGIGEQNQDPTRHDYYRPIDEWREFFIDQGFEPHWEKCCRYAVTWYACERIEDRLGLAKFRSQGTYDLFRGWIRTAALSFDRVLGPALTDLTPTKIAGRQMMLWRVKQ